MRSFILTMLALGAVGLGFADDLPLRVYAYGAAGASVYVTPVSAIAPTEATDADIGYRTFWRRFLVGKVPVEAKVKPGQYLVSVVLPIDQNMRDAALKAKEYVWDGYNYHGLIGQMQETWRYAQCYLVEKKQDWAAEVLAVFTDQMPEDEVLSFDCGPQATRYTGTEDDAGEALTAENIPMMFHRDIIQGLKAGHKVLLRSGLERLAIQTDGPLGLRVTRASGYGAWAAHRLSIVDVE